MKFPSERAVLLELPGPSHGMQPMSRTIATALTLVATSTLLSNSAWADDWPTPAARQVAADIRREAILPPHGPSGRPLPLASHWNQGTVPGTFEPDHQLELLQQGHHILPWLSWPEGDPDSTRFAAYYERLLSYFAQLQLPISIRGTQWNAMLVKKTYRDGPESQWAGTIAPDGSRVPRLSPFGPLQPWRDPARQYIDTPAMRRAQQLYPNPPLVLLVSNNEPPDLRWSKQGPLEDLSRRYLDQFGRGRSDELKRRVVGEGWQERYRVMFQAMREALANDTWRRNVRFVGYGAFGPSHFGRWDGWQVYSLISEHWTAPDWHYWQGGSPSYYTNNWSDNRDHWVFSTQVESMNWLFMLDEAWQANPDFWFEISTWDGNEVKAWLDGVQATSAAELVARSSQPLTAQQRAALDPQLVKKSKALQYLRDGQTYPPERTAGWVQFGLWLLRRARCGSFAATRRRSNRCGPTGCRPFRQSTESGPTRRCRSSGGMASWSRTRPAPSLSGGHPRAVSQDPALVPAEHQSRSASALAPTDQPAGLQPGAGPGRRSRAALAALRPLATTGPPASPDFDPRLWKSHCGCSTCRCVLCFSRTHAISCARAVDLFVGAVT